MGTLSNRIGAAIELGAALVAVIVLRRVRASSEPEGQQDVDASDGAILALGEQKVENAA